MSKASQDSLSPQDLARYSRHLALPEIGTAGQQKLADAAVLIVGLGGLGGPAALYLAAAGVGRLGLAEFDSVELSNLQRQILYSEADIGQPKLESAVKRLQEANSQTELNMHPDGITVDNALDILLQYDVVIDASDNFPTRYLVNDAAFLAKRPVIYGSLSKFEGQVSVFASHSHGPCYRCLFPEIPETGAVPNCTEVGVLGALCGLVGSFQAMEAIKYVVGIGQPLIERLLVIEALDMAVRQVQIKRDPDCPLCGTQARITDLREGHYAASCSSRPAQAEADCPLEVDVDQAKELLKSTSPPYLLDVREAFEVAICQISGSRHIPMDKLAEHYASLPEDRPILVYCHHGFRSFQAAHYLRKRGLSQASSLSGGIDQWAIRHNPDMERY